MYHRMGLVLLLFLMLPIVSALSVTLDTPDPNGLNNFYNDNFMINATTDFGPVNATFTIDFGSGPVELTTNQESDTFYTAQVTNSILQDQESDNVIITVEVEDANGTDSASTVIKVDTVTPDLDFANTGVNVTQAAMTDPITITIGMEDQFPGFASVGVGSYNTNVTFSGDSGELETTPEDLGCSNNATCDVMIQVFDESGNAGEEGTVDFYVLGDYVSSQDGLNVNLINPANNTVEADSIIQFKLEVEVVNVSVPTSSTRFCNYQVYDEASSGSFVTGGTFYKSNFTYSNDIYKLNKVSTNIEDGNYRLEIQCFDDEDNEYKTSSNFVVLDMTAPTVIIEPIGVSDDTINITVNSTEEFKINDLIYKVFGTNETHEISTSNEFAFYYEFSITGLESGVEYAIQAKGVDKANRDETEFVITEIVKTGGINDSEPKEKSKEDVTVKGIKKNTTEKFVGEEYNHGIDWAREDEEVKVNIANFEMHLRELLITSREDIRNIKLDITTSKNSPGWLEKDPSEVPVYEYILIEVQNAPDDKLKTVKLRFEVNQVWLNSNEVDIEDVVLYRLVDDGWVGLPTSLMKEGALLHTYEALSPGFSLFAISGKEKQKSADEKETPVVEKKEEEKETPIESLENLNLKKRPWYWWVLAILSAVIVIVLAYYASISILHKSDDLVDHTVVKSNMKKLEDFVDSELGKGKTKQEIKNKLLASNWDERLIDFVLRRK